MGIVENQDKRDGEAVGMGKVVRTRNRARQPKQKEKITVRWGLLFLRGGQAARGKRWMAAVPARPRRAAG